jgi:pyruvate dehydrogenase E1 component alpha subunit
MERAMAELFGRATGFNRGKGGSMHIADFSVGMLGANGVVADGMPIAVGAAHALKLKGRSAIVACFFGDGAINRGPFLEALNWAALHALPVLFVCEDNRWSATTPTGAMTAGEGALARARAIGVPGVEVDGNDVFAVDDAAAKLVPEVRSGQPRFLHAITYRFKGHVSVDAAAYRDGAEVSRALENDPLVLAARRIPEARRIFGEAEEEVRRAVQAAAAAPWPPAGEAYGDIQDTGAGQWR